MYALHEVTSLAQFVELMEECKVRQGGRGNAFSLTTMSEEKGEHILGAVE